MIRTYIILLFLLASGYACFRSNEKAIPVLRDENPLVFADRFSLVRKEGYTLLRIINPWQGAGSVRMEYFLVKKGDGIPAGADSSDVIFVPVNNVICMSVTHAAMISALGEAGSISAMSGSDLIYNPELRKIIEEENIPDVGYEAGLNNELILKISPELVIMYGIGGESAGYTGKIEELGIKVLFNADYLETDALAKAEWIKLFGALYCREDMADSIFRAEAGSYEKIRKEMEGVSFRPKVMLGLPYKDTWYISPGNSYISRMIADAGGEYLWSDTESSESMPVGLENVYMRALDADFWLNTGTAASRNEILAFDSRFGGLDCFRKGNIFNNNGRLNESGGNDYWETGAVHPHLILKDLSMIFHPEKFGTDKQLFFYRKLP